jgi:DNA-binding NtrC family response regulator
MHSRHLRPDERDWLALLCETVFANPFGVDRARLGRLLGRAPPAALVSQAGHYGELLPALDQRLAALAARGLSRLEHFSGDDRALMTRVFLFRCWQAHLEPFDDLIAAQRRGTGRSWLSPQWLHGLLERLAGYGFGPAEAARWVALFYQLRRAYHFIDQALIGRSEPMRALRQALWNSVFTTDLRNYALLLWDRMQDFPTLLLGETGTGKGSAAAAIGRSGPIPFDAAAGFRHGIDATFIATNLSELSETLIESELFGHCKGAFTGAVADHDGLFTRCGRHTTLFLDEIGDVAMPVQTKLLRVLQERTFQPVGGHDTRRFEGRVVAATNRPLEELLGAGRFRDDLFYRLSANIIRVPTLRERLAADDAELAELADALLTRMAGADAASVLRGPVLAALDALPPAYAWPGNVRELEQAIRRILVTGRYHPDAPAPTDPWLAAAATGQLSAAHLLAGYCRRLYSRTGTYEAVARITGLDRRTVKRHIDGPNHDDPAIT